MKRRKQKAGENKRTKEKIFMKKRHCCPSIKAGTVDGDVR